MPPPPTPFSLTSVMCMWWYRGQKRNLQIFLFYLTRGSLISLINDKRKMTYCQDFVVGFPPSGHRYMSPGCDRKTRSGVTLVIGLTKVILSCIKITQRAHFVFKLTETRNQDFKQKHIILKKKLPSQPPTPKQRIKKQNKNKKTHTAQKIKI